MFSDTISESFFSMILLFIVLDFLFDLTMRTIRNSKIITSNVTHNIMSSICFVFLLAHNVSGLAEGGDFTTKLATKPKVQIYEKLSNEALLPRLWQAAVIARFFYPILSDFVLLQGSQSN